MKESEDFVIRVSQVDKSFNVFYDRANTLKERMLFLGRNKHKEKRQILKNINVDIKKGETVALIGVNGSGKSTLLKLMTQIIYPNKGTIETRGKLTSLLELGAGFHPDFSGRENIYFNAAIFGLTRNEIDKRVDAIIEFSELKDFIDNPVRTYSSGMYMRLAFSVAINVDAEILLIDEILSVGDQHFQEKCFAKMHELRAEGKTMVFVTHSMDAVRQLCDRAVWIYEGKVKMDGGIEEVVTEYLRITTGRDEFGGKEKYDGYMNAESIKEEISIQGNYIKGSVLVQEWIDGKEQREPLITPKIYLKEVGGDKKIEGNINPIDSYIYDYSFNMKKIEKNKKYEIQVLGMNPNNISDHQKETIQYKDQILGKWEEYETKIQNNQLMFS